MTRGHRLSEDLRRVLIYMYRTCSIPDIVNYTGCKKRTVQRILLQHRTATPLCSVYPRFGNTRESPGRRRVLTQTDIRFLQGLVRHTPDIYLDELQEQLELRRGVVVSVSTIWKALRRTGYTMKKLTRDALERSETKRATYRYTYGLRCTAEQTVFVDESSFDRRTSIRRRAWSLRGQCAMKKCFFVRGKRYSLLPALSTNGIIHAKIVEGSFTAGRFYDFIDGLLDRMQPFPLPNSVVIMDNAHIHSDPRVLDLILERGMRYMFLPPYSPDYNPIELAFSTIKAFVRRAGELGRDDLDANIDDTYVYVHLLGAAYSITSNDAANYYRHCGYLV